MNLTRRVRMRANPLSLRRTQTLRVLQSRGGKPRANGSRDAHVVAHPVSASSPKHHFASGPLLFAALIGLTAFPAAGIALVARLLSPTPYIILSILSFVLLCAALAKLDRPSFKHHVPRT